MQLKAIEGDGVQKISLEGANALGFREGRPNVRAYDSCFYEVGSAVQQLTAEERESMKLKENDMRQINVIFSKLNEMNVYIYGGKSRYDATMSLTEQNLPVVIGKNYTVPVEVGMLIVAYPNENVDDTTFEFSYSVVTAPPMEKINRPMIAIILCVVVVLLVIVCLTIRHCKNRNKIEILSTPNPNLPSI